MGGQIYNETAIIERERSGKVAYTRAIYKIEGSTTVVNYR
jgi:hypothetical protein